MSHIVLCISTATLLLQFSPYAFTAGAAKILLFFCPYYTVTMVITINFLEVGLVEALDFELQVSARLDRA